MSIQTIKGRMEKRLVNLGYKHINNMFIKQKENQEGFVSFSDNSYFLYKRTKETRITATAKTRHSCYNKFVRMTKI